MTKRGIFASTALVATVMVGAATLTAVPAYAGAGYCRNALCLWDDKNYNDTTTQLSKANPNFNDAPSFNDKTSSVVNASGQTWKIYDDTGYQDRFVCLPPGKRIPDLGVSGYKFNDKTSSARPVSGC